MIKQILVILFIYVQATDEISVFQSCPKCQGINCFYFQYIHKSGNGKKNLTVAGKVLSGCCAKGEAEKKYYETVVWGQFCVHLGVLGIKCLGKHSIRDYFAAMLI